MKQQYPGFGFDPDKYTHFFSVHLPSAKDTGAVKVVEHFDWKGETPDVAAVDPHSPDLKVMIKKEYFREVADAVKAEFNRRLTARGLPTGRWPARGGTALLSPRFGKELVLLLWAIEEVQLGDIQTAIYNWLGLAPEERWWLYTMTNAATGQATTGRNRGWRKAVRFALCENPVQSSIIDKRPHIEPTLFEDEE